MSNPEAAGAAVTIASAWSDGCYKIVGEAVKKAPMPAYVKAIVQASDLAHTAVFTGAQAALGGTQKAIFGTAIGLLATAGIAAVTTTFSVPVIAVGVTVFAGSAVAGFMSDALYDYMINKGVIDGTELSHLTGLAEQFGEKLTSAVMDEASTIFGSAGTTWQDLTNAAGAFIDAMNTRTNALLQELGDADLTAAFTDLFSSQKSALLGELSANQPNLEGLQSTDDLYKVAEWACAGQSGTDTGVSLSFDPKNGILLYAKNGTVSTILGAGTSYAFTGLFSMPSLNSSGLLNVTTSSGSFTFDPATGAITVTGEASTLTLSDGATVVIDKTNGFAVYVKDGRITTVAGHDTNGDGVPDYALPGGGTLNLAADASHAGGVVVTYTPPSATGVPRIISDLWKTSDGAVDQYITVNDEGKYSAGIRSITVNGVTYTLEDDGSLSDGGAEHVSQSETWTPVDGYALTETTFFDPITGAVSTSYASSGLLDGLAAVLSSDDVMKSAYDSELVSSGLYDFANDSVVSYVLSLGTTVAGDGLSSAAIGAFYESTTTAAGQQSPSIAASTPVLLGTDGQGLSVSTLAVRDVNGDGMLSGTELNGLSAWVDTDDGLVAGGDRQVTTRKFEAEKAKILRRCFVAWIVDERGETFDVVDVSHLGLGHKAVDGHVVDQALVQRADGCDSGHGRPRSWFNRWRSSFSRREGPDFYGHLVPMLRGTNAIRSLICAIFFVSGMVLSSTISDAWSMDTNTESQEVEKQQSAPKIDRINSIDLSSIGKDSWVKKLTFSPDGRYLAIVDDPNISTSMIIIWDLENDREQARITGLPPFGDWPQIELLWSPNGNSITYGSGKPINFWDPLTGFIIKELTIDGPDMWSRYNKDGTRLLVNRTPLAGHGGFRIYETKYWTYADYGDDGLSIRTMCWTADNMVMVAGVWATTDKERTIDNQHPKSFDVVIRLIDPAGNIKPRSVLVPAIPPDAPGHWPRQVMGLLESSVNYTTNKIIIDNFILDGRSLEIFQYATDEEVLTGKVPAGGSVFSPDGKYIYLLGRNMEGTAKSLMVEADSGKSSTMFPGGQGGIAVSTDGRKLAIGNGSAVDIYVVE